MASFDLTESESFIKKLAISDSDLRKMYRVMLLVRTADIQIVNLQRQGRIGFYVPGFGEEACQVGSAFALSSEDWIFPDYRSGGVFITRGLLVSGVFPLDIYYAQLIGNSPDILKGHSMPSHWGSRTLKVVTPSSPLCTQLPHAVGFALGAKLEGKKIATITYFGDGGTSTNDFHSSMNFAGVFKTPTVFFCRNNRYAISVPVNMQTASKSLVIKAEAYGIEGIQVDGNDIVSVYATTRKAIEKARNGGGPTMIEALTYRMGPHSTSDDPTRYRSAEELEAWRAKDPIKRFREFLEKKSLWNENDEKEAMEWANQQTKDVFTRVEQAPPVKPETIFDDLAEDLTWNQKKQLKEFLEEFGTK